MRQSIQGLEAQGIKFEVFDKVRVEPNDERYIDLHLELAEILNDFL